MSSTGSSSWWQPTPLGNNRDPKRVACLPVLMGGLSVSSPFSGNVLRMEGTGTFPGGGKLRGVVTLKSS